MYFVSFYQNYLHVSQKWQFKIVQQVLIKLLIAAPNYMYEIKHIKE